jgi:hypothetical protein
VQYEGKGLGAFSSEVFKEPRDLSSLNVSWLVLLLLLILLCSFMTTSLYCKDPVGKSGPMFQILWRSR